MSRDILSVDNRSAATVGQLLTYDTAFLFDSVGAAERGSCFAKAATVPPANGPLVGRNEEQIAELEQASGAVNCIVKSEPAIVSFKGPERSCAEAKRLALSLLEQIHGQRRNQAAMQAETRAETRAESRVGEGGGGEGWSWNCTVEEMNVPTSLTGLIVGLRGALIKEFKRQSGAQIDGPDRSLQLLR